MTAGWSSKTTGPHITRIALLILSSHWKQNFPRRLLLGSSISIYSHCSKSQIFVQKKFQFWRNFTIFLGKSKLSTTKKCKSPTFSRVFRPKFFWQFFSWNQSCQQLKSPKPQLFREFFTQKNRQFLGNQSWIVGQKKKTYNSVIFWNFIRLFTYFGNQKYIEYFMS